MGFSLWCVKPDIEETGEVFAIKFLAEQIERRYQFNIPTLDASGAGVPVFITTIVLEMLLTVPWCRPQEEGCC